MSNQTVLNPDVHAAVINSELGQATAINPDLTGGTGKKIAAGTILGGKYQIVEPLSVATGEADLYVCRYNESNGVQRATSGIKTQVV